jgi:hypothetical protein
VRPPIVMKNRAATSWIPVVDLAQQRIIRRPVLGGLINESQQAA